MLAKIFENSRNTCLLVTDLKPADIDSTNENSASPDGNACNLRMQNQHQILISSPLRQERSLV